MNGWVNAHTHLEGSGLGHLYPAQPLDFTDWIYNLIQARRRQTREQIIADIEAGIAALHTSGTVAVGDISATGLSVEPLLASGLAGVVYYEVLGTQSEPTLARLEDAKRKIDAWRQNERNGMRVGLTIHAPYSTHPDVFRAGAKWCIAEDVPLCVHLAEAPGEVELLTQGSGTFYDFEQRLSIPRVPAPGLRPLPYMEDLGVLEARPLLVHMVEVTAAEIAVTCQYGYSVVHCPRSNTALRCNRFPLEHYLLLGVNVALGTDSLASSPSLDVSEEVEAAYRMQGEHYPLEIFERMATEGGLIALGLAAHEVSGELPPAMDDFRL